MNLILNSGLQTQNESKYKRGLWQGTGNFLINPRVFSALRCALHTESVLVFEEILRSLQPLLDSLHFTPFSSLPKRAPPSECAASASAGITLLISNKEPEKQHASSHFWVSNLRELSERTNYYQNFSLFGERCLITVPSVTLCSPFSENVASQHCQYFILY